jgi:hypothetical protein
MGKAGIGVAAKLGGTAEKTISTIVKPIVLTITNTHDEF